MPSKSPQNPPKHLRHPGLPLRILIDSSQARATLVEWDSGARSEEMSHEQQQGYFSNLLTFFFHAVAVPMPCKVASATLISSPNNGDHLRPNGHNHLWRLRLSAGWARLCLEAIMQRISPVYVSYSVAMQPHHPTRDHESPRGFRFSSLYEDKASPQKTEEYNIAYMLVSSGNNARIEQTL